MPVPATDTRHSPAPQYGAALDTHRRAEQAVTTARTTAATAAQHARDAYDAAKSGGWTAAELNKSGLCAPAAARTRTTTALHNTGSEAAAGGSDNAVTGAA